MTLPETAQALLHLHADPFSAVRDAALAAAERHTRAGDVASYQRAREVATLVAAARASYVLVVNSGFAYLPLHIAATFGHTGQVDVVETDPGVVAFVEQEARRQSLSERIRLHLGTAAGVLSSLNGPYDAIILGPSMQGGSPRFDDLVRLVRTGGSIVIHARNESPEAMLPLLELIAADARLLSSFPDDLSPVIAVRRR